MFKRRSIKLPVTLGVLMIVTIIALTVGWILLSVFGAAADNRWAPLYWTLLTVGTAFLVFVLVGVVLYLRLSIETINLSRRQSNFIDSVTHELKSPIASLKLYLQTLTRRQVSPQEQADFFRFMIDDLARLDALINHLLDAAQLDQQPISEKDHEDVRLDEFLRQCAQSICTRYRLPLDTIQLQTQPVTLHVRPVDLDLIFRNLIDNAVKYAADEPRIEIDCRSGEGCGVVHIEDNGKGIPTELRRVIFSRFYRMGEELERETPGLGLGLFIVRTRVRRLKGKVRVRDRKPGPGTVFEVTLPAVIPNETLDKDRPAHQAEVVT